MKHIILGCMAIIFIACESSSPSSTSNESGASLLAKGGTVSSPAKLTLGLNYQISTNNGYNYYQYTGKEDEKLRITLHTDHELTSNQELGCLMKPGTGDRVIIYDEDFNRMKTLSTCGVEMIFTYLFDSTAIIRINYKEAYFGEDRYLTVSSIKN